MQKMKKIKNCFRKIRGFDYKIIFRMVELLVAAAAIGAFCFQYESLQEQRIATAWQILANKAAGNSGKIEAIEFLAKQGKPLQGIDMSKKSNGGRVYLSGLDVSKATLGHQADLVFAKFEGAYLWRAHFEKAVLQEAHFEKADLFGANFEGARLLWANFEGAYLHDARFLNNNLTVADFRGAKNMDRVATFKNNFVWSDADKPKMADLPTTAKTDSFAFEFDKTKPSEPHLDKDKKPTGLIKHFIKLVFKTPSNPN